MNRRTGLVLILLMFSVFAYYFAHFGRIDPWFVAIRTFISIPSIVFTPGYFIMETFTKEKDTLAKFLMSVGLSLSILGIWAIFIDMSSLRITPELVGLPALVISVSFGVFLIFKGNKNE